MARWAEWPHPLPGVDIVVEPEREYPMGPLATHLIGHVGRLDDQSTEPIEQFTPDFYIPEMEGKTGVEKTFNDQLAGKAGGRLLQIDASGFKHRVAGDVSPEPGHDVRLTLDARVQQIVEHELAGQRGACVVMDPRNGDVLAMASSPSFDPHDLRDGNALSRLMNDAQRPLFNRAIAGVYPPGSTFKPVFSIAALENHRAQSDTAVSCPGYYQLGNTQIRCWRKSGHGLIEMQKAIEQSCNTYFCALGLQCGYERIYHMAAALGFGFKTGITLSNERSGLLPDDNWKRRVHNDGWRSGDTCNVSIGQGPLLVTPLQMAVFTAALANGGHVYQPRLTWMGENAPGVIVNEMSWSPSTIATVRAGMMDVVEAPSGTGKRAKVDDIQMAGKTGSAEYGPREDRKKHAWMILYAPVEQPRYALAMVIEDGTSGGMTTAPHVHAIMAGLFNLEKGIPWTPITQEGPS